MKRFLSCMVVLVLVAAMLPIFGSAAAYGEEVITETFADGSYVTEYVFARQVRVSGTTSGSKVNSYYNSQGILCWQAVLNGSFSYTGSGATCTASSCSVTSYGYGWYTISKNASRSGNTASATVTMGDRSDGVLIDQVSVSLTLRCDKNGNLS